MTRPRFELEIEALPARDTSYVFDNAGSQTRRRFVALPAIFDPGSIRHLSDRGVGPGWQCLEVGAGDGSIAAWLAQRAAPSGRVLATDIDPRFMETLRLPCLEVRRHDITLDPLPERAFDLIHARLVLCHLPLRDVALARIVAALKPGGWLVVEDFDALTVREDPRLDPAQVRLKSLDAIKAVMAARGVDLLYGRRAPAHFRAHGLIEVESEARAFLWRGRSLGASLVSANLEQLRAPILASRAVTEQELDAELEHLQDPDAALPSPVMWATWGRRPAH